MYWQDEGYLLFKNNFDENSIIMEAFTLGHGKCSGIVYGGNSRNNKKIFQVGNKITINFKSKSENRIGYFTSELIKPVSPMHFDDKKKSICILSATSLLKILLPENQLNKKIYISFENFINSLNSDSWIIIYIFWELSLVKELGFEVNLDKIKNFKIPSILKNKNKLKFSNLEIIEALNFNKFLLQENFILPNKLRFPLSRNILEKYFN